MSRRVRLEPDIIMPAQFFDARQRRELEPQRKLAIAILRDAIDCYREHARSEASPSRQLFVDAEAWITSCDRDYCFSFENVCELLGMDPDWIRQRVLGARSSRH